MPSGEKPAVTRPSGDLELLNANRKQPTEINVFTVGRSIFNHAFTVYAIIFVSYLFNVLKICYKLNIVNVNISLSQPARDELTMLKYASNMLPVC